MIKLVALVTRKPGMTEEDFHQHWRETHAPLVGATKSGQHALRYEQNHRANDIGQEKYGAAAYDGVTIQWFASMAEFEASIQEDDYAQIAEDMVNFLDMDKLVWFLTEDDELIWDHRDR